MGWQGETLWMLKLRTRWDGDRVPGSGWIERIDDAGPALKTPRDPRVGSRFAQFCRRHSIDELPQLWHVVRGEMSLVGPRPHAARMKTGEIESSRLIAEYAWRCRIKPGMTGWAAIRGSRGPLDCPTEVRRRVALDIEYIERQSLWLDLWILLMTVPCLLGDRRAVR